MPLPSSPPITLQDINTEFGGTLPSGLTDFTGQTGAAPSNPVDMTDYLGAVSYTSYDARLDAIKGGTTGGATQAQGIITNTWYKITGLTESGTMWGQSWNGGYCTGDSVLNRVIQHLCPDYSRFNQIVTNAWASAILIATGGSTSTFSGTTRNNYTSLGWSGTYAYRQNFDLIIWDGTLNRPRVSYDSGATWADYTW